MARIVVTKTPTGYAISWPNSPISASAYKKLRAHFLTTGYGPATSKDAAEMNRFAEENGLTRRQVESIRNTTIKDKIVRGHGRMNALMPRIAAQYRTKSILQLSREYDFPPLNLLRGILLHLGIPAGKIYQLFTYKVAPDQVLSGRELREFADAERGDANAMFNQDLAAERAAQAERNFVSYLRGLGLPLRTQEDLARDQVAEFGRAVNTPDVLFDCEVIINGEPVKWIDYKDYVGTTVGFLLKSNREQAGRYDAEWGRGAICYGCSFVEGMKIDGAQLLDGSIIKNSFPADI